MEQDGVIIKDEAQSRWRWGGGTKEEGGDDTIVSAY